MRLTNSQLTIIKQTVSHIFGVGALVYLFGSRVDDAKKGGDIDLYIVPEIKDNLPEKKIQFLTALVMNLGDQKIDVIIAKNDGSLIEKEALKKGIELSLETLKLEKTFKECDKHLQRINEAYGDMAAFMPLNAFKYEALSKQQVQAIDQYLFRFSKLQDTMGEKLFKLFLARFEENIDRLPFIDILNKLEKYLNIALANEWQDLRKIRNQLAHEYEDDAIEMANMINLIYAKKEVIERIYLAIKDNLMVNTDV
ncbi:MAG: nucleotidyltransferase domain-containing protein [Methylococcaceae bacterium]